MGGPAAANALEMAAGQRHPAGRGRRRLRRSRSQGGVGDLVVVSGAVRGEGTSRYYAPVEFPAAFDPVLTATAPRQPGGPARHPPRVVFTTDAGYRQGPEIYETYAGLVLAVESECAAVAVVGARLGLEAGALLFCTDNVTLPEDRGSTLRRAPQPRHSPRLRGGCGRCRRGR